MTTDLDQRQRSVFLNRADGSCAEHLTAESYTVFICQQSYLLLFRIPSPTHSLFHSKLMTFLFCKSFPLQPFLFLLRDSLHGIPRLFTVISEHIGFLLLVFVFLHFLVVGGSVAEWLACWTQAQ